MEIFKIRKKGTDLFSSGGWYPHWESLGKTWHSMAAIEKHLRSLLRCGAPDYIPKGGKTLIPLEGAEVGAVYYEAEVVTFHVVETQVHEI